MKVIEVTSPSGQTVYIEVDDQAVRRVGPERMPIVGFTTAGGERAATLVEELEKVGEVIAEVCGTLHSRVTLGLGKVMPGELTLAFGVTLAGEAGLPLVTKGSVEGTFNVTARWTFTSTGEANAGAVAAPTTPRPAPAPAPDPSSGT